MDAISRIISDDVLAIGVDGLGSKATMIEATQDEDEPTELELYCKEHPDAEKCQDNAGG